jgi:GTPase SAR1 family protein
VGQESVWNDCVNQFETPSHIFITGSPGCGKTTLMRELLYKYATNKKRPDAHLWGYETTDECMLLGPEQDRGIQTIRGQVSMFIRQKSIGQDIFRWVIIDDVDTFPQISQQALRRPMESYSHITRFLFLGTSEEDLIPALRSRCIHIKMNNVSPILQKDDFLTSLKMPSSIKFTHEMWSWLINIIGNNISDLVRLLKLIKNTHLVLKKDITLEQIKVLCSSPFYNDFIPLLMGLSRENIMESTHALLNIWKRGYAYEDILESFQTINTIFGNNSLKDNIIIHKFLINSWIAYCKGNTSILSLQNVLYRTLYYNENITDIDKLSEIMSFSFANTPHSSNSVVSVQPIASPTIAPFNLISSLCG